MLISGKLIDPKKITKSSQEVKLNDLVELKTSPDDAMSEIKSRFDRNFHFDYKIERVIENGRNIFYIYTRKDQKVDQLKLNPKNSDFWFDKNQQTFISTNKKFIKALPKIIENTISN